MDDEAVAAIRILIAEWRNLGGGLSYIGVCAFEKSAADMERLLTRTRLVVTNDRSPAADDDDTGGAFPV